MVFDLAELLTQADTHLKNKNMEQAESIYLRIREYDSINTDALNGLAVIAIYKKNHANAYLLLNEAIQINPKLAHLHYNISICHYAETDIDAALLACQQAINLDINYKEAQQFLTSLYSEKSTKFADMGNWQDALNLLKKSLTLDKQFIHADIYYQLGFYSEKLNQFSLAKHYWKNAILTNPDHPHAQLAIDNLHRSVIPNWHVPMINDTVRNNAFQTAIEHAVNERVTLLDIGAGSGLLAMIAARAGTRAVYACEEVELLADKASEIIRINGFNNRQIKLLKKRSTQITIPIDIPQKVDIIVTETFGTGLIEENCLETINHAVKNLLAPNGKIIPKEAAIHLALIESNEIYQLHHIESACDFDLTPFNELSETLNGMWSGHLNHYQYQLLSSAEKINHFNFYSEPSALKETNITLTANNSGVAHALCLWFDLYLDDTTMITSNPTADNSIQAKSWGQKIRSFSAPFTVCEGDKIAVKITYDNNYINMSLI